MGDSGAERSLFFHIFFLCYCSRLATFDGMNVTKQFKDLSTVEQKMSPVRQLLLESDLHE